MLREVQDRYLPPDRTAFVAAEPPTGRVIIIAPTRAACETIEIGIGLHLETYLETTHGERLRELARSGKGFGIIAGTGTGKTLAIRPIAEEILRAPLKIGVVNREREATPELPNQNAIVVTTGIARRWFQDGDILPHDTLVVDEIHQTSAELELCLALGKRVGCRFIWLSATVDPRFYRRYLNSADVLEVYSFDPKKAADVRVSGKPPLEFLSDDFVRKMMAEKRGVGLFLPTRAGVEQAATDVLERFPDLNAAYYHGGEPVRVIRPFLEGEGAAKPYLLAMTAAGQSALNVRGLDTVVIDDTRFTNIIQLGRNVLTRQHLGSNEILQMAGRVHGRVEGGRVFILSDRPIDFKSLKPTPPEFQLAGNSERVALTCADMGVRADELDLPVPLDKTSYRRALTNLQKRGIITDTGRLSTYGRAVEALPVDRPWAELLVNAPDDLVPYLAVMSSIESLHRMTREERNLDGLIIVGSDHVTTYNLYAEAYQRAGYIGQVYGMPRHLFEPEAMEIWAEERGVLVKAIEDAALAMASVMRALKLKVPQEMPLADRGLYRRFTELLAQHMPFDLVIEEQTPDGQSARVSKSSVCGSWGAVAGTLRYFADRFGVPRAAIEGTQIPLERLSKYAQHLPSEVTYDGRRRHTPLVLQSRTLYHGFELASESEPLPEFVGEHAPAARAALARALSHGATRHPAETKNRAAIEEVRELYRRSGGTTPRLGYEELADHYQRLLEAENVTSWRGFQSAKLLLRLDELVPAKQRRQLWTLPLTVQIQGKEVTLEYDVEEIPASADGKAPSVRGIVRLFLPEKVARTLTSKELPKLDRDLRFEVNRGQQGSVRAASLEALQNLLEGPWTPSEGGKRGPERGSAPDRGQPGGKTKPRPRAPGSSGGTKYRPKRK